MFWYERRERQMRKRFMRKVLETIRFAATEIVAVIGIFCFAFCIAPLIFCAI